MNGTHGRQPVDEILETYTRLRRALQELHSSVQKGSPYATAGEVADELNRLRSLMVGLFEYEEEGGLFEDLLALLPNEDARISALKKDHVTLIRSAAELSSRLGEDGREDWKRLRRELIAFVLAVASHDDRETKLALRPYYTDEGTQD